MSQTVELGTIEREIHVDASPEVVFEVISTPAHVREWWSDEADFPSEPGGVGWIGFGEDPAALEHRASFTVVDKEPPHRFSFRWCHPEGVPAAQDNSFLVTFELSPSGGGTLLRLTETGFREQGWEVAVLEEQYQEHVKGWNHFVPRLADYAPRAATGR